MICANILSCGASYDDHFAPLNAYQVNQVEYLPVINSSHVTFGYYPIHLVYGDQRVDNTNSTMNNAIQVSGICIDSPSSFTSSYCTFSKNKESESKYIYFSSTSVSFSISFEKLNHLLQ